MSRTVLFAYDTVNTQCVWNATASVNERETDFHFLLLAYLEFFYSTGWANLSAKAAIIFAITRPHIKHGSEHSFQACFEERRMDAVCQANLHTFSAPDASLQKFLFAQGSRRTDQAWILKFAANSDFERRHKSDGCKPGTYELPSGHVHADRFLPFKRNREFKRKSVCGTCVNTIIAYKTFRWPPAVLLAAFLRMWLRRRRTSPDALTAPGAFIVDLELEQASPSENAEKSAERAKIPAPKSRAI
jgi:hypothetical protein